jgi:hypothetical protein
MHRARSVVFGFFLLWPTLSCADFTFSEAAGVLAQRSYAEGGAALVKRYAASDIEARRLYAEAKAAFDGLIEQLLIDLAQDRNPQVSPDFHNRLELAVRQRIAFSIRANEILRANIPEGAKSGLLDALAKVPVDLIKELVASSLAIWKEWRSVGTEQRRQIATRLEAMRWKPFAEITPVP